MSTESVCLIQWLDSDEYAEVRTAWKQYQKKIKLRLEFPVTKQEIVAIIGDWLAGNDNSQLLYIGSHGTTQGIGPRSIQSDLTWSELATALAASQCTPVLMLGACYSSCVAAAWCPIPTSGPPAEWITTFPTAVSPDVLELVLQQALGDALLDPLVFMDKELPRLQNAAKGGRVEQFYPARTLNNKNEYVNVDQFKTRVGVSLEEFLRNQNRRQHFKYSR